MILDQSSGFDNASINVSPALEWQQQVTDGIGGVLAGIELFNDSSASGDVSVSIGLGSGFFTGSFTFSTTATIVQNGTFIDTSAADIELTPGQEFVIDVSSGSGIIALEASPASYAGGDLFVSIFNNPAIDETQEGGLESMAFETFIEGSSAAPEPGTLALFSLGLFGLTCILRRRVGFPSIKTSVKPAAGVHS